MGKVKVYYAAAMLGDRSNLRDNKLIFEALRKAGFDVLTEHVVEEVLDIYRGLTPREIFERDIKLLEESDVVVADISYPSLGVGFEIAYGLLKNRKVIAICREDRLAVTSALIRGITWNNFHLLTYTDPGDVVKKIMSTLGQA